MAKKAEAEMELYRLQVEIYEAKVEMHKRIMEEKIREIQKQEEGKK